MDEDTIPVEENLARRPGVRITVSQPHPRGGGSRDPYVLFNETAHRLDRHPLSDFDRGKTTYDTYSGQTHRTGLDWYALEFPEPVTVNCVEMTMGYPHRDGGWWTSLDVEVRTESSDAWSSVAHLDIVPPYRIEDTPIGRRPFETYTLTFDTTDVHALRVIGKPGGCAPLTSLARLAVYQRDRSRWNPLLHASPPVPQVFRLIAPHVVFDLSESFAEVTGLAFGLPLMEYYLDAHRFERFWRRVSHNYLGEPDFSFLMGERMGWNTWNRLVEAPEAIHSPRATTTPYVHSAFHDTLADAVAPIVIDGQIVGEISTGLVLVKDRFDWSWHRRNAQQFDIPWGQCKAAIKRTPQMTLRQLQATAEFLGMIANTIANLAHRLDRAVDGVDRREQRRKQIVRRAIDYMETHLDARVTVADAARAVDLTLPYFSTLFTEETGRNPSDFLIGLRIERAKEYLAHTTLSVVQVADLLGYSSPSHFSRLFKKRTGCPPSYFMRSLPSD
jgi:AraC-like DNA-binding protein